ncbi:MAG: VOC family protein [Dehalococcoidia bacterium]
MPNPVVSFEVRGPDAALLRQFYRDVFEWETFEYSDTYAGVETTTHTHDEATGVTTYTGADAFMNDGVVVGSSGGQPGWKFPGEPYLRSFEPGIAGGVAKAAAGVTFYIQAKDLDATLAKVEQHGGTVVQRPTQVAPNVVVAAFRDPAGNEIGLTRAPQ